MDEKRAKVSFEEVSIAAEALTAAGLRPSVRAVHAKVGGGSLGTIQKHLNQWAATRKEIVTSTLSIPIEIQRVILTEIEKQVSETRSILETELTAARQDRDEISEESEALAERLQILGQEMADLQGQLQQKLGSIEQIKSELSAARMAVEKAKEAAKAEIEVGRVETERLVEGARQETEKFRLEAQDIRNQLAKAELRLEALPRLEKEADRLRQDLDAERENRHKAEQALAVCGEKVQGLESRLQDAKAQILSLGAGLEKEQKERRDFEKQIDRLLSSVTVDAKK